MRKYVIKPKCDNLFDIQSILPKIKTLPFSSIRLILRTASLNDFDGLVLKVLLNKAV